MFLFTDRLGGMEEGFFKTSSTDPAKCSITENRKDQKFIK